jgi:HEAT repeat protein
MIRKTSAIAVLGFVLFVTTNVGAQRQGFISVDGPNLKSRVDSALRQANGRGSRFWIGYQFNVRPGVAIDYEFNNSKGRTSIYHGTNITIDGRAVETRNVGIFLRYEPNSNTASNMEIYNLDRQRDFNGWPVYWLGLASNDESLNLLRGLVQSNQSERVSDHSVLAIAVHDDARVDSILEDFIRNSSDQSVRKTSVFWLGQTPGNHPLLGELVRNNQENTEIRKQAAFAIGISKDAGSLSTLEGLYGSVENREVKKQIIFAASINENKDAAANFLIKVAESDPDREAKKQALFWIGQMAGNRSLQVLGDTVDSNDADTEIQKQAVFAISQRPKDEAVPLLIKIARTHSKAEIRKQAIFWLGQTGDDRALEFFKEILK